MAEEIVGDIICRKRGDTAPDKITILDPESATTPLAPLDITGFSFVMTINTEKDPEAGVGTELAQINGVIIDAPAGIVEFRPTVGDADQIADVFWYDIEQIDAAAFIKTIAKNKYIFFQDIGKTN